MLKIRNRAFLFFISLWLTQVTVAHAATILIASESGMPANGYIDWGPLGPTGTLIATPFAIPVTGIPGLSATVSRLSDGAVHRSDQVPPALGDWIFNGNFSPGEQLINVDRTDGDDSLLYTFNQLVKGVGAQVSANWYGPFTATIEAFDAGNISLGSYIVLGNLTNPQVNPGDTTPFIGILSDAFDIASVRFSVAASDPFIGAGDEVVMNGPLVLGTPEPGTWALFAIGAVCLMVMIRRRLTH
jgi:hypothetical protein